MQRDIAQLQDQVRALQSSFDQKMATIQTLVQQALDAAKSSSGPDIIRVGPGTYDGPFSDDFANPVTLKTFLPANMDIAGLTLGEYLARLAAEAIRFPFQRGSGHCQYMRR